MPVSSLTHFFCISIFVLTIVTPCMYNIYPTKLLYIKKQGE